MLEYTQCTGIFFRDIYMQMIIPTTTPKEEYIMYIRRRRGKARRGDSAHVYIYIYSERRVSYPPKEDKSFRKGQTALVADPACRSRARRLIIYLFIILILIGTERREKVATKGRDSYVRIVFII